MQEGRIAGSAPSFIAAAPHRRHASSDHRLGFTLRRFRQIIIRDGAPARAFKIIELPGAHGPEAGEKSTDAQPDGDRQENDQNVHDASPRAPRARSAFNVTRIEDPDMASAATNGVAWPLMAMGTAMAL